MRFGIGIVLSMAVLSACVSSRPGMISASTGSAGGSSAIARNMNGGLIGRAGIEGLGRGDMERALEAEYRALEYSEAGTPVNWSGSSGMAGEVMAAQPYRVGSQDCRSYVHKIQSAAGERILRATACRNPDGSWTPLS